MKTVKEKIDEAIVKHNIKKVNNNNKYVDLGLPSGTLWATCNLGADKPEDDGDYFAWGETKSKNIFIESDYTLKNSIKTLSNANDAATKILGNDWKIPSKNDFDELCMNCELKIIGDDNKNGILFTSKNNKNQLFLPFSGWKEKHVNAHNIGGFYWKNTAKDDSLAFAFKLFKYNTNDITFDFVTAKYIGCSIRPVSK